MSKLIDITGNRYGRLVVIKYYGVDKWGQAMWLCQCDCGNTTLTAGYDLRAGRAQSCGCARRKIYTEAAKKWRKYAAIRYNLIKEQTPEDVELDKIEYMKMIRDTLTEQTGKTYNLDHIQPISKGGAHCHCNLQILLADINAKKHNKIDTNYKGITYEMLENNKGGLEDLCQT